MVVRPRRLFTVAVILAGAPAATGAAANAQPGALGVPCLMMAGAGHAGCRTTSLTPLSRRPGEAAPEPIGFADFAAGYSLYRLVSATDPHRACRLQPTCSLFAAQAARRVGWWRGLLMGLARAQTAHTDQDGFLLRALAPDGQFIFLDPVDRWLRRAP
jgi:hypothetical protein